MKGAASELSGTSYRSSPFQGPLVLSPLQNAELPLNTEFVWSECLLQVTGDLNLACILRTEDSTAAWLPFPDILEVSKAIDCSK